MKHGVRMDDAEQHDSMRSLFAIKMGKSKQSCMMTKNDHRVQLNRVTEKNEIEIIFQIMRRNCSQNTIVHWCVLWFPNSSDFDRFQIYI